MDLEGTIKKIFLFIVTAFCYWLFLCVFCSDFHGFLRFKMNNKIRTQKIKLDTDLRDLSVFCCRGVSTDL